MKNSPHRPVVAALLVVAATGAAAAGKTYRWVDAQGHPHYGDVPSSLAEEVKIKPGSGSGAAAGPAGNGKKADATECQRRKDQLAAYKSATTVTETDAKGKTREYSAAEKEKLVARTEEQMHDACGDK